jgi:uncharacterized membrane protein YraQ (UPF0718 family)
MKEQLMPVDIERIIHFIVNSFVHVWPYLLLSIPLAVVVNMSGASRHIKRAFDGHSTIAILLAVVVGTFSPFCSCGVIPVVASLLVGGVPLAPVMAFWIASPSMDPEIFFLSVASLGWNLAIWRFAATLAVSLLAGFVTRFAERSGWLGEGYLKLTHGAAPTRSLRLRIRRGWLELKGAISRIAARPSVATTMCCASGEAVAVVGPGDFGPDLQVSGIASDSGSCESCEISDPPETTCDGKEAGLRTRLLLETAAATWMVGKFMALAFFLGALIQIYIPAEWIAGALGARNPLAIPTAAILGIPIYTSNLTALPVVGGLLAQGMNPGAALAFLIAGPTTTLPAMAAVWGLVSRRVFALYVGFALAGALACGLLYDFLIG